VESLRKHELAAVKKTIEAIEGGKSSGLWSIVDRLGTDRAYLALARRLECQTLILVAQRVDLDRTRAEALKFWPSDQVGILQGPGDDWRNRDLVIGCVSSLSSGRLAQIARDEYSLVVVADCHHAPGKSWRRVLAHFTPRFLLGISATPDRLDGHGLEPWFGKRPIFHYPLHAAISDGVLVAPRQVAFRPTPGTSGVPGSRAGRDSTRARSSISRDELDRKVVGLYMNTARGRKAVVFAQNRTHVKALVACFTAAGIPTGGIIAGLTKNERDRVLEEFASGRIQVLVNCRICTHGFSDPAIEIVTLARPTRSRALYQDSVLVGLEPCPRIGKKRCLVWDLPGNSERHSLLAPDNLTGTNLSIQSFPKKKKTAMYSSAWRPVPAPAPRDSVEASTSTVSRKYPPALPWPSLDPLWEVDQAWRQRPASSKQLAFLRRLGAQTPYGLKRGEASDMIDRLLHHR
jgi:type I site-specific restriction endonuclease